jgi:transcriptional repressor NrdR
MKCPFCQSDESKVLDSRPDPEGKSIRRRRECGRCGRRWRTLERVEDEMPLVIKKNGTYEPFNRDKLLGSMQVSCGKRPVTLAQLEKIVADIEWDLLSSSVGAVESTKLGEKIMAALKSIDEIAYIRFASVYRRFKDAEELISEMRGLIEEDNSPPA